MEPWVSAGLHCSTVPMNCHIVLHGSRECCSARQMCMNSLLCEQAIRLYRAANVHIAQLHMAVMKCKAAQ